MIVASAKWFRRLLLTSIHVLGVLGILGSSGGSDNFIECDDPNDFPFICPVPYDPGPPPDEFDGRVFSIVPVIDSSDDYYVIGEFTNYKKYSTANIARFNNDGSLDTSFSTGGGFNRQVGPGVEPAIDGSGAIFVGGQFTYYDYQYSGNLIQLKGNGVRDTTFNGTRDTDSNGRTGWGISAISLANNGSGDIYVGGGSDTYNGVTVGPGVIRINSDGSLDQGFATGSDWGNFIVESAANGSGDVYASKYPDLGITRMNSDGSMDAGFSTGISGFDGYVRNIVAVTDGSGDIYVGGNFSEYNGVPANRLVRLNIDGTLDSGFTPDSGLMFEGTITPTNDGAGDIYVTGLNNGLVRLNNDGSIDTAFDISPEGFISVPRCVAIAPDGSGDILVCGREDFFTGKPSSRIVRLSADGAFVY